MADFLDENIPSDVPTFTIPSEASSQSPRMISQTFHGFAALFDRLAQSFTENNTLQDLDGSSDIEVLDEFVHRACSRDL